jgi:hypothetical protein
MSILYIPLSETIVNKMQCIGVTYGANYNVLWLYISVDYSTLVNLLQTSYHLVGYHKHGRKRKPASIILHL